ncbi:unnamed protein product [Rotaria magnacalcarata]|uniref:F-box domain-containing protein n=1 Tax=Rotaria magnacalcarata TaxID=392030 RepID=A0A8S3CIW0_9BILA|nr:unnamed protein product [Rotaria magnacalcarata]
MKDIIELFDLPDELLLAIMKKVNPQVLFLCSMINIGNFQMFCLEIRKPLITFILQFVILINCNVGENVATLCRSSLIHSIQSFEFDENLIVTIRFANDQLHFDQLSRCGCGKKMDCQKHTSQCPDKSRGGRRLQIMFSLES